MAEAAEAILAARQGLEQALRENPGDFAAHIKLAQLEARAWAQDPGSADLSRVVTHMDLALGTLPESHHPQLFKFAAQLQQRGANIASLVKAGPYPRLLALLMKKPVPRQANGSQTETAPPEPSHGASSVDAPEPSSASNDVEPDPAPPASEPEPSSEPPREESTQAQPPPKEMAVDTATPLPGRLSGANFFREADVGEVTNAKIKEWLKEKKSVQLASAYPLIESFRTRRTIVDRLAETKTPEVLRSMVHMICHEHDEKPIAYLVKKILTFEPSMICAELQYDPLDSKHKGALVRVLSNLREDACVAPLTKALRDRDPAVRVDAVRGLGSVVRPSGKWLQELARLVRHDRDPKVRLAAGRALQTVDTVEAFEALNDIARQTELEKTIQPIWEAMNEKFITRQLEKSRAKWREEEAEKRKKNRAGSGTGGFELKPIRILQFAFLLAVAVGLSYFGYQQYLEWTDPFGYLRAAKKTKPAAGSIPPTMTLPEGMDAAFGANR